MESLYLSKDYRQFVRNVFKKRSKNGFGQAALLAKALRVHSTFVSQVLKGTKSFSPEQALTTADFLELNELETEYFLLLIHLDRAGTPAYRGHLKKKLGQLTAKAEQLVHRIEHEAQISEEKSAIFYSDWIYSAVRLCSTLPGFETAEKLSQKFSVPLLKIKKVIQFLVECGLIEQAGGTIKIGPKSTHLKADSPWIKSHHTNWRQRAFDSMTSEDPKSLHYSAPMVLSFADTEKVREILVSTINNVDQILGPSECENFVCLNIDLFAVK